MNEFEVRAVEHLRTRGVDARTVEAGTLRLEPFGGAFLLRFDGAVVVSVREAHELLGATQVEPDPKPTGNGRCGACRDLGSEHTRAGDCRFRTPDHEPTPEQVEVAARAMYFDDNGSVPDAEYLAHDEYEAMYRSPARVALTAVARMQTPDHENRSER